MEDRKHTTFGGEDLEDDFDEQPEESDGGGGGGGSDDDANDQPAVSAAKQRDGKGNGKGTTWAKAAKAKVVTF